MALVAMGAYTNAEHPVLSVVLVGVAFALVNFPSVSVWAGFGVALRGFLADPAPSARLQRRDGAGAPPLDRPDPVLTPAEHVPCRSSPSSSGISAWRARAGASRRGGASSAGRRFSPAITPTDGLTAGIAQLEPGGHLALHRHDPAELYFLLEGEAVVTIDGAESRGLDRRLRLHSRRCRAWHPQRGRRARALSLRLPDRQLRRCRATRFSRPARSPCPSPPNPVTGGHEVLSPAGPGPEGGRRLAGRRRQAALPPLRLCRHRQDDARPAFRRRRSTAPSSSPPSPARRRRCCAPRAPRARARCIR